MILLELKAKQELQYKLNYFEELFFFEFFFSLYSFTVCVRHLSVTIFEKEI